MTQRQAFSTRVIHAGEQTDPVTGAVNIPIYASSTYRQRSPGVHSGFEYSRSQNPTRFALERCIADLEEGESGFAFASGLAASSCVLDLLPHGSHLIAFDDLYGGTHRLFEKVRRQTANLEITYLDMQDLDALTQHLRPNTKMIWVETPSNPLLKIVDLEQIATFAQQHGLISVADNTFATPWAQRPLTLGFDLVVHSATKYLNGHSDVIGGLAIAREAAMAEKIRFLQNASGGILSPHDSFMILRGIKTLSIRMERHTENAWELAQWLAQHEKVDQVFYPGLTQHTGHRVAAKQMHQRFGGMISLQLRANLDGAKRFLEHCQIFTLAESLGGVESLIEHPALMTHASIPAAIRHQLGIEDGLIRLSVGIEDVQDLRADLTQAFSAI